MGQDKSTSCRCAGMDSPRSPNSEFQHSEIIQFDGLDDPESPFNWSLMKNLMLAFSTFTVGFNSSLFSSGVTLVSSEYGVSHDLATLGVSLYVLGFATGPILWAPLSEFKGRRMPIVIGMLGFSVFSLGVGAAKDIQTVLICRFCAGVFGASAMTLAPAILADIFDGLMRGPATTAFSINILMGPMLAPSVGGFICQSYLGWRWTAWLGVFRRQWSAVLLLPAVYCGLDGSIRLYQI